MEVVSWENDGDNYRTKYVVYEERQKALAVAEMCATLFKSCNNGDGGVGNSMDGSEDELVVEYMRERPILYNNKNLSDERLIHVCRELAYTLMGSSEYYDYRVCQSVKITYSPEDIFVQEIKF